MKKILNEIFIRRIFGCFVFILLLPFLIVKFLVKGLDISRDKDGSFTFDGTI